MFDFLEPLLVNATFSSVFADNHFAEIFDDLLVEFIVFPVFFFEVECDVGEFAGVGVGGGDFLLEFFFEFPFVLFFLFFFEFFLEGVVDESEEGIFRAESFHF